MNKGKLIIFSAPSGSGKTTIVKHLLQLNLNLEFSISATNRPPRGNEINGKDYYFLSEAEFKSKIVQNDFLEWEEVYQGCFYGTLKSEVDRITNEGHHIIFDIDVVGGINIKKLYKEKALSVFIQPPSIAELQKRLKTRSTDSDEVITHRIDKAETELSFAPLFDRIIINDQLNIALIEAEKIVREFIKE